MCCCLASSRSVVGACPGRAVAPPAVAGASSAAARASVAGTRSRAERSFMGGLPPPDRRAGTTGVRTARKFRRFYETFRAPNLRGGSDQVNSRTWPHRPRRPPTRRPRHQPAGTEDLGRRRSGAVAHDEVGGELDPPVLRLFAMRDGEHEPGGRRRHLLQRLPYGGQRRPGRAGQRQIVEAHNGQVVRHAHAGLARRLVHAEGLQVAASEDRGRAVRQREQISSVNVSGVDQEVAITDELGVDGEPGGLQRGAVAVDARPAAQHVGRAADHADPAVAVLDQMPRGRQPAVPVGGADRGDVGGRLALGVDDDERDAARGQLAVLARGEARADQHHPVGAARRDAVEPGAAGARVGVQHRQDHPGLRLPRRHLRPPDQLHRPGAFQLGEHEVDQAADRPVALRRAPAIAVLVQQPLDALPGLRSDLGPPVHDLRHGRHGHAGLGRDPRDRHSRLLHHRRSIVETFGRSFRWECRQGVLSDPQGARRVLTSNISRTYAPFLRNIRESLENFLELLGIVLRIPPDQSGAFMTEVRPVVREAWRDPQLPVAERVTDLLSRMTMEEKAAQLAGFWAMPAEPGEPVAPKEDDIGEPALPLDEIAKYGLGQLTRVFGTQPIAPSDGIRRLLELQTLVARANRFGIPAIAHEECLTGFMTWKATIFPALLAWGASFDPGLVEEMAAAIGAGMRRLGVHQGLAPVLDVVRDYRWGRNEECIGEDPYLVATIGSRYVRGLEGAGIVATLKHFAGYSSSRGGRNMAPTMAGPREFADVILEPFVTALRVGGARSVMHSYTDNDGVPAAADEWLLTDLLRDEMGFGGLVVSDYFGVSFLQSLHRIAGSRGEAAALALRAGLDVELPTVRCYGEPLLDLVRAGQVPERLVDRAAARVLTLKAELGLLDDDWEVKLRGLAAEAAASDLT